MSEKTIKSINNIIDELTQSKIKLSDILLKVQVLAFKIKNKFPLLIMLLI